MKTLRVALLLFAALSLGALPVFAETGQKEAKALTEALPADAAVGAEKAQGEDSVELNRGLSALLQKAANLLPQAIRYGVACGAKLLLIALLVSVVSQMGLDQGVGSLTLSAATALCIVLVGVHDMTGILGMGKQFVEDLNAFSKALMPTLTAASAAAGAPAAALARQTVVMVVSDLLITALYGLFLPLIYAILALRTVGMVSDNPLFPRLAGSMKQFVLLALRYMLVLYFGYLTVTGIISGTADTLARRAAKTAITTGVPVVGGMISEATDSVLAGAAMVRNSVGVVGVLGILGLALLPLLYTGINYLTLRLVASLSSAVSDKSAAAIDILADTMSMLFAIIVTIATMLLITVVTGMKGVGL